MELSFFEKEVENISYSDLQKLVEIDKIPESYNLDYKLEYPKGNKLPKLIIALANATGGYIIIGVEEEKLNNKNTGIPKKIVGIEKADHMSKITNIILSHSQPKIVPSINQIAFPTDSNKVVVVIKVYEALEPIMYYSKNDSDSNKWFIRINDKIEPADYSILKKLFYKENYLERMKRNVENEIKLQDDVIESIGEYYSNKTGALLFGIIVIPYTKDFTLVDMKNKEFETFLNHLSGLFHKYSQIYIEYRLSAFIKRFRFMGHYYESKIEGKNVFGKTSLRIYEDGNIYGYIINEFNTIDSDSYEIERVVIKDPLFIIYLFIQYLKLIKLVYDQIKFREKFKLILRIGSISKFILQIVGVKFESIQDIIEIDRVIYCFDLEDNNKFNEILLDIFHELLRYFCEDYKNVEEVFPFFQNKIPKCFKNFE